MSLWVRAAFAVALNCLFVVQSMDTKFPYPSSSEVGTRSQLTEDMKEKYLDQHNELRGTVQPPAADMEYMLWSEDLANLAQMWSDRCRFEHGYGEFGPNYSNAPFEGEQGQNLAMKWGEIKDLRNSVKVWFDEGKNYDYRTRVCSKPPCGHYTQMAWSRSKYLGCSMKWCPNLGTTSHPQVPGETIFTCDYGPAGNVAEKNPYKQGTPCTKCISGNGFCYKNLCRDCKDFRAECGKSLTAAMCTTQKEMMSKRCPKMCNLCECPLRCQNGGTLNTQECKCGCPNGFKGLDCSEKPCPPGYYGENCELQCYDRVGKSVCKWRVDNGHDCKLEYMKNDCAETCGYCGTPEPGMTVPPTTAMPTVPILPSPPRLPGTVIPPITATNPALPIPSKCTEQNTQCPYWAASGECERNPVYMLPNCCESCKGHTEEKECTDGFDSCPLWAFTKQCEMNRSWMMKNCRKSCYQCGECKDLDAQCSVWAHKNQCTSIETREIMTTKCRDSCGMCRVYDRFDKCPAWAATGDCDSNRWAWTRTNCPNSCHVPYSESTFCEDKSNGNFPVKNKCKGYIACSWSITTQVSCPIGKMFDKATNVCKNEDSVTCIT